MGGTFEAVTSIVATDDAMSKCNVPHGIELAFYFSENSFSARPKLPITVIEVRGFHNLTAADGERKNVPVLRSSFPGG